MKVSDYILKFLEKKKLIKFFMFMEQVSWLTLLLEARK